MLYSAGSNDECMTLDYAVKPIIKYIPKDWVVWCPFDTENSEFVKQIRENGNKVIRSHISEGKDFYTYEPDEHWDCIISNPPFCFDSKTEIFTKNGWKNYITLLKDDEVLSLNPHTQNLEWCKIESINKLEYKGEMFEYKTKSLNLCVTPYHRMYAHKFGKNKTELALNKGKTDLIQASEIIRGIHKQLRTGYGWSGNNIYYITIPSVMVSNGHNYIEKPEIKINIKDWLAFFGLWLADGYCRHTLNSQGNQRYTSGIKQQNKNELKVISILDKLPFKYSIYRENGTDKSNYEIHDQQLWEYLIKFGKSSEKYIPFEIKNLNKDLLEILLENYLFGDSYRIKNGAICISTMSKQLSEDLQEIVLKLGDVINFTEKTLIRKDKNYGKYYISYWNKHNMQNSKYPTPNKISYDGTIFCPELVKNGVMLVRRNGKISFSGNTNKRKIFERALSFNKPFALIMSNTWLNDSAPKQLFMNKDLQLLMFNKRMKFMNNGEIQNKITFSSSYFCWNFLPKQIIMEELYIK